MKIRHSAAKTSFFKLVGTYELDLDLGPQLNFSLRLELFKDTERKGWFRAHVWELEYFNLEPTFPSSKNGKSRRCKSSEKIMLERITQLTGNYGCFEAESKKDALLMIVTDLKKRIEHWTNVKAK